MPVLRDEFLAEQEKKAVDKIMQSVPSRLRKKIFALRLKVEWMVKTYGIEHVGLQTMTIRENVTDRKEFERRFKSISTNVFPKLFQDWLRVFERQQGAGPGTLDVVVVTKDDIWTGTDVVARNQLLRNKRDRKISKAVYYSGIKRLASPNLKAAAKSSGYCAALGNSRPADRRKGRVTTNSMRVICCRLSARFPIRRKRSRHILPKRPTRRARRSAKTP